MTFFSRRKKPETVDVGTLIFLREQKGVPEEDLKRGLEQILAKYSNIERAYLAAVQYGRDRAEHVALCIRLRSGVLGEELLGEVESFFNRRFASSQALDIITVNILQERSLAQKCRPFYSYE